MKQRITWGGGLNTDVPPFELADGAFNSGQNVRVRNGIAERIGGTSSTYITFATVPAWLGVLRHTTPSWGFWLVGASSRVYATDFTTSTEITPYTDGATVSSATAEGTTVTFTFGGEHGRTTGDTISAWGFSPSTYNVDGATITVTSPTKFTFTVASAPATSPATTIGMWAYHVVSPRAAGARWSGGEMGGVLFLQSRSSTNVGSHLYYWAGNTSIPIRRVPGAYSARVSRPFGNYIVQLSPAMGGTEYPYRILWSTSTEPGAVPTSFDASTTNDAGYVDRTEGGECIDCLPLGAVNIIYKQAGRFAMEPIPGSSEVFRFTQLPGSEGLLYSGCVVGTPVGHVFLSSNYQVLLHTGGECRNLSAGRVNNLIYNSSSARYFVTKNAAQNEVWIYIVTSGSAVYPQRALVWNWKEDKWGVREYGSLQIPAAEMFFHGEDRKEYLCAVDSTGKLVIEDVGGSTLFGNSFNTEVERTGMDAGEPDVAKNLQRSRWNFDMAAASTATIAHGSAMTADASPTYATGATYTVGTTDYVNARATAGKYLAIKATWTSLGGIRSTDLDFTAGGTR